MIFVHGTGVRAQGFNQTYVQVQEQVAKLKGKCEVCPCFWGEALGAQLHFGGKSIPDYDATKSAEAEDPATEEEAMLTLWRLLFLDPLFEFRLMSDRWTKGGAGAFGVSPLEKRLQAPLDTRPRAATLRALLPKLELERAYEQAVEWLRKEPEFKKSVGDDRAPLIVARALVARMAELTAIEWENFLSPLKVNPGLRNALVEAIAQALTEQTYGLLSDLAAAVLKPLAAGVGTHYVRRHRGEVSDASAPAAGDILLYQARGGPIRDRIRAAIAGAEPPVVLLAHSLGGIACVDLLAEGEDAAHPGKGRVSLLITAGSQAPYFYEIGALQSLPVTAATPNVPLDQRLPKHFPAWLNFYDPRDFLSYQGQTLFGQKITDKRVNNGLAFPDSHSGYWSNSEVWATIGQHLP